MNSSNMSSIPYLDFGGAGTLIHFAHANGYPPACYKPLFSLLCKEYHVISMLQRPLWENSDPDKIRDWDPFASDLLEFLNQQNLNSSIAIGHSLGGIVSLKAAILEPNRFQALILIDPVLFSPLYIYARRLIWSFDLVYRIHPLIKATRYRRRVFTDFESMFDVFRTKPVFRYMDNDSLIAYIKGITVPNAEGGFKLFFSPEWEMRIYATGIWNDLGLWKNMSKINIPVMVIKGEETGTFLNSASNLLKKRIPTCKIVTIENTTHLVPLEVPGKVNKIIVDFLEEKL